MSTFVRHRVVLDTNRGQDAKPPFQFQVSGDGGETWQAVILKGDVFISGGKGSPLQATITVPLYEISDGRLGAFVEGEHLPYEDPA